MADFEKAIGHILRWEGGLVDHPADPGGLTNRGITLAVFKLYADPILGVIPTPENLKQLTEIQARKIYEKVYWQRIKGYSIDNQNIADALLDGHVNMGFNGIKLMQKEAGVESDGLVGPKTIRAINLNNPKVLFDGYRDARIFYYKRLAERKPQMEVFLQGWLNRVNDLKWVDYK